MHKKTQVAVVDGGPAKCTAAALLARQGVDVTVLARERFPRYHVGEPFLPPLPSVPGRDASQKARGTARIRPEGDDQILRLGSRPRM
ncbi:tryptophan 7-halogenase [Streptomyces sp. NPDC127079]|uniref:tryptophan 7-halogenase n=1 Tax=Streptomyces sp. NPDC127079 TaxID=3347132 RepID=UPI00364A553B